ncbi:PhoH family protein [Vulcanisaeta distributa]|uniref:PhoH family protein n=1 Tax=Vulcanisaeta distributa TaxID=164451 RepID=UPI0006CF557F|nr:PhoH family protein [Vulcanisaeta distributa]
MGGQGFATDLLRDFNEGRVRELLNQCGNVGRVIVLGPPSSGKSFFINNYVRTHCPNAEVLEYVAGLVEEAPPVGGGGRESMLRRIIDWFNRSSGSEDLNKLASELGGLSNYSVNELRRVFGGDKVPKDLAEQLRGGLKKRGGLLDSALITYYYVPSDLGIDTIKRINDILRDEGVKFSWLGREYVPPALIRLVGEYGEGELRRQLRLYREVSERLSVGDDIANWISGHLREFVEKVLWVASYIVPPTPPLDAVLAIVASSISWGGENPLHALLGVINDWNNLNEGLRSVIMHNLAHRLGIDINVIRKLFNTLSGGVDHRKLEELSNVIGELTLKVELMGRSGGRIEVFTRGDMARGVLDVFKRDNEYMLNYGTGTVKLATTSGYEGLVSGLIDEFMRSNVVVLVGPRGIGKTVLGSYTAVKMLEDGKVSYIIRVRDLTNEDYMKLHYLWVRAFLSDSLIVYDPSPITTYMEGEEPEEITGISQNIEWLIELSKLKVRLLLILPSDLYESLTDEVKAELSSHIISQEEISKALRNEEFLTAVIKAYSGCSDEAALRSLASEVLKFNEGVYAHC